MKVREKIYDSIRNMDPRELSILYGQIKLMESMKSAVPKKRKSMSIERIHEMTSSSKRSWADAVVEDREDRV